MLWEERRAHHRGWENNPLHYAVRAPISNNLINALKPLEESRFSFVPFWFLSIPEVETKITSWIILIHQSPLCVQNLDTDIGDLGECVQAPIARRFAPNVCSALAPPGACSQATTIHLAMIAFNRVKSGEINSPATYSCTYIGNER